jgi:hypothetical protein
VLAAASLHWDIIGGSLMSLPLKALFYSHLLIEPHMQVQEHTKQIVCINCGSIDDYRTEMKANNLTAYCNGCDRFITNIPYKDAQFYFGKYKGIPVANITDLSYLQWAINNIPKLSAHMRAAIHQRIYELKNLAR